MCGLGSLWDAFISEAAHWGQCPPRPKFPLPFPRYVPLTQSFLGSLASTGCHYEDHHSFSTLGFKHKLCHMLAMAGHLTSPHLIPHL